MKLHRSEKRQGASAVEMALLLPLLVFLYVIGVDFARVFYYSQVIENCARNGALYASDPKAPAYLLYSSASQAALADATGLSPQPTITTVPSSLYPTTALSSYPTDAQGNYYVQVTATWTFGTLLSYTGISHHLSLSRTVQMRMAPQ